jgi:hypothetical protein
MNMSATIGNRTQARPEATSATAGRPCLFPDQLPAHLRDSYETLALIATPDHLAELDPADARTLIVCCDWVMWQDLIAAGRHAVHYELGILDWQRIDALNTDLFLHADDWILAAGANDPSLFRGVSIGRLFGAEMSMVLMNHHRLERALRALIDRFRPRRIDYYAFRYDVNYLRRHQPAAQHPAARTPPHTDAGQCECRAAAGSGLPRLGDHPGVPEPDPAAPPCALPALPAPRRGTGQSLAEIR